APPEIRAAHGFGLGANFHGPERAHIWKMLQTQLPPIGDLEFSNGVSLFDCVFLHYSSF
ncbi:hypothetical protein ACJX0J_028047, partial [Zea mays]